MENIQIIPTITAENPQIFAKEAEKLHFAPRIHVDISDGIFAPSKTVNLNQVYWDESKEIDLHLMICNPQDWLHQIISLNPKRVIFHVENFENNNNYLKIRDHLMKFKIDFYIALLPNSQPADFSEIIKISDGVLIFGGNLGFQGGEADLKNLNKIDVIREIKNDITIAWDGGANLTNINDIVEAGVTEINVGSGVSRSENPEKIWNEMMKVANNDR